MKNIFYTLGLLLVMPAVHADGVLDDSLESLGLSMLKENTVKLAGLATSRCLNFLDCWQFTMRAADSEIVMRETFKGRLGAWVGAKVSSRDSSVSALHSQKDNLQSYGENVAAHAARFALLHEQCKQAEGSAEVYQSAQVLFDVIAQYALPQEQVQRDPEVERLFERIELLGDAGEYTDRVVTSLSTVSAMPMRLQRDMPYQSASLVERYGAQIVLATLTSLATGAYMVLGGASARNQVIATTTKVAHGAYAQVSDSMKTAYSLVFGKEEPAVQALSKWRPKAWLPKTLNPKTYLSQWASTYYNSLVQPKIELGKAAGLTTMLGTVVYKSHSAAVSTFTDEILGVVNRLSLMLNKYDNLQRSELSESDQGFLLLWTRQLRRYRELAPDPMSHTIGDILAALDDDRLSAGQKLSAINISLRRLH